MKSPFRTKLSVYSPKDIMIVQVNLDEKYEKKDPIRLHSKNRRKEHSHSPLHHFEGSVEDKSNRSIQDIVEKQFHPLHGSLEKEKAKIQFSPHYPPKHNIQSK